MVDFSQSNKTYKILEKLRLEKGDQSFIGRKIVFFIVILWLPMLLLSLFESTAFTSVVKIPFLLDYAVYARFLIAMPMLFIAERIIKFQNRNIIQYFIDSGIIANNNADRFHNLLRKVIKIRESSVAEIIILILSYLLVLLFWSNYDIGKFGTSWAFTAGSDKVFSLSGYWYYYVAVPIYQFFFFRIFWRYLLWAIFMWKISRMPLNLYPTNPDLAGGLGFLGISLIGFALLGFAQSSIMSGTLANELTYTGGTVKENTFLIISSVLGTTIVYLIPAFFFIRKLINLKLKGLLEYGVVTSRQTSAFFSKWVRGGVSEPEQFLSVQDFSAHTDMNTIYEIIRKMRLIPIELRQIVLMILIIFAPYSLLFFIVYPAKEIFEFLLKFII